jgi:serine phosphatase RsbU (regulator of sigma subunit)
MKRLAPYALFVAGIVALYALVPRFNGAQPRGTSVTRGEAKVIADRAAAALGIPVDRAWANITWVHSGPLDQELEKDPARRRSAEDDPVIGPRLGGYKVTYYRPGLEKFPPYGHVVVSERTGDVIMERLRARNETAGAQPSEAQLRPAADSFVRAHRFTGAATPVFESARPTVQRNRTDWVFRYRVPSTFPSGNVVPYLWVHFVGDRQAGWDLIEEYADGRQFRSDNGSEIAGQFIHYGVTYLLLFVLLVIFLKKYHAGEVGIGTASLLFGVLFAVSIFFNIIICPAASEGSQWGGLDAGSTSLLLMGFKLMFYDIPAAILVFFAWAVGESYARERWGERLASFDAILRRDPLNATVGRSTLTGLLTAPAVAAAAFLAGLIPLALHRAYPMTGPGTDAIVALGGPSVVLIAAFTDSISFSIIGALFILAAANRRRVLWLGIVLAVALSMIFGVAELPIGPYGAHVFYGFGAGAAALAVFMGSDLLSMAIALFGGAALVYMLPFLSVARGDAFSQAAWWLAVPMVVLFAYALIALATKREVVYAYEDLAPHVKRIVERERVKAEIDAANRIQAALLPLDAPLLAGATVSSHYRAASEIGGDYFDFLPQPGGEIGIAFGDVSGHGLTSGIVMAMAKSALLVQVDYDASPRAVMNMLNDIVIKTAPRRILMTFFFGLLDPRSQSLRFSSAGHLDPYVYRAGSGNVESLSSWGFPLGVKRRDPFREHTVEFSAGDRLILYSDGLIEAVDDDGEPFGFERFERTLREFGHMSADDIKKTILGSVRKFTRNRPPDDDQTLVVVSFDEELGDSVAAARVVAVGLTDTIH